MSADETAPLLAPQANTERVERAIEEEQDVERPYDGMMLVLAVVSGQPT